CLLVGSRGDFCQGTVGRRYAKNELTYGFQSAAKHKPEAAHCVNCTLMVKSGGMRGFLMPAILPLPVGEGRGEGTKPHHPLLETFSPYACRLDINPVSGYR
ncbi:hypothetical protein UO82_09385, partial [Enterobacter hormaechei]